MKIEKTHLLMICAIVAFIALFITVLFTLKLSPAQNISRTLQEICGVINPIYTDEKYTVAKDIQEKFFKIFKNEEIANEFLNKIGISSKFELINESEMPTIIYDNKSPWIIEDDYIAVPVYNQVFEHKSYVILLYKDSVITTLYNGTWTELITERR